MRCSLSDDLFTLIGGQLGPANKGFMRTFDRLDQILAGGGRNRTDDITRRRRCDAPALAARRRPQFSPDNQVDVCDFGRDGIHAQVSSGSMQTLSTSPVSMSENSSGPAARLRDFLRVGGEIHAVRPPESSHQAVR
jgi:hypothetical protein